MHARILLLVLAATLCTQLALAHGGQHRGPEIPSPASLPKEPSPLLPIARGGRAPGVCSQCPHCRDLWLRSWQDATWMNWWEFNKDQFLRVHLQEEANARNVQGEKAERDRLRPRESDLDQLVIPALKLSDQGLFDGATFEFTPLLA